MAAGPLERHYIAADISIITCSICLNTYNDPKSLPCHHTFCNDCLKDCVGNRSRIACPLCRLQVSIPRGGVSAFGTNFVIRNLMESAQKLVDITPESETTADCSSKDDRTCPIHPSKEMKYFCETHSVPICEDCLFTDHNEHRTKRLQDIIPSKEEELVQLVSQAKEKLTALGEKPQYIRQAVASIETNMQTVIQDVIGATTESIVRLEESMKNQRDALIKQIEKQCRDNISVLSDDRSTIERDRSLLADTIHLSEAAATHKDALEILSCIEALKELGVLSQDEEKVLAPMLTFVPASPNASYSLGSVTTEDGKSSDIEEEEIECSIDIANDSESSSEYSPDKKNKGSIYPKPVQIIRFGHKGSQEGEFDQPVTVIATNDGLFVLDQNNHRIQIFDMTGKFKRSFPVSLPEETGSKPCSFAINPTSDQLVVLDSGLKLAKLFTQKGKFLQTLGRGQLREPSIVRYLEQPQGIIVSVTDKNDLVLFDLRGEVFARICLSNECEAPSKQPIGPGHFAVANNMSKQLLFYRSDFSLAYVVGGWGKGGGRFKGPIGQGTYVGSHDIVVPDQGSGRLQYFDRFCNFLGVIADRDDGLGNPSCVTSTPKSLVVSDVGKNCIFIFNYLPEHNKTCCVII
ncbi:tripartite motif-containing protein 2-like [Branchiostoma lanceolatum]|uniref:tripartite motif-containing protein 2-like n=1 Tax=Branchiostoma lanceolatum TaxID=7740 RepID=UPI0034552EF6